MPKPVEELEEIARDVGREIGGAMPSGVGFALLVFDFGSNGTITYVSNARREDMIAALKNLVANMEAES